MGYPNAGATFLNEGEFDHSPVIILVQERRDNIKKPFKYYTMWKSSPMFNEIIKECWSENVAGNNMFKVTQKLERVKSELKNLNKIVFLDIEAEVVKVSTAIDDIQRKMHLNLGNSEIADEDVRLVKEYKTKHDAYMSFLQYKAMVTWLKDGDKNSVMFHQSISQRRVRNSIYDIYNMDGEWQDNNEAIQSPFLEYYQSLLGTTDDPVTRVHFDIVRAGNIVTQEHKDSLLCPYTPAEVRKAMFSKLEKNPQALMALGAFISEILGK